MNSDIKTFSAVIADRAAAILKDVESALIEAKEKVDSYAKGYAAVSAGVELIGAGEVEMIQAQLGTNIVQVQVQLKRFHPILVDDPAEEDSIQGES